MIRKVYLDNETRITLMEMFEKERLSREIANKIIKNTAWNQTYYYKAAVRLGLIDRNGEWIENGTD